MTRVGGVWLVRSFGAAPQDDTGRKSWAVRCFVATRALERRALPTLLSMTLQEGRFNRSVLGLIAWGVAGEAAIELGDLVGDVDEAVQ